MAIELSDLLEFLRSKYNPDECESLTKASTNTLQNRSKWVTEARKRVISVLKNKYWSQLENIISCIYNGNRSKYSYIIDGIDFIHHLRVKTDASEDLYDYIIELYVLEKLFMEIEHELLTRITFKEIIVDDLIDVSEYQSLPNTTAKKYNKLRKRRIKRPIHY